MRGEFDAQTSLSFRPRAGTLMFALQVAALADETRAKKKKGGKRREAASRRRQRAVDQQSVVTRSLQYRRCEWRRSDEATEKKNKKNLPRLLCSCICLFVFSAGVALYVSFAASSGQRAAASLGASREQRMQKKQQAQTTFFSRSGHSACGAETSRRAA